MCLSCATRIGIFVYSWIPTWRILAALAIATFAFLSSSMHAYCHCCLFWLSFRFAAHFRLGVLGGGAVFAPWLGLDIYFLRKLSMMCNTPHIVAPASIMHFAFKVIVLLVLYFRFNVQEAMTGRSQSFCVDVAS
eukprot:TRINITY_DN69482_c0_g1_i1.p2 TRINITY_DN69482_c0_g1~~TRINITY_DN69482_c0_g1_i1.p2  ORF type:complete len:134 (+),score=11.83 TRINITY_DN69482_c0_g1_i1:444-845(+)